jgi:hypothetical protein
VARWNASRCEASRAFSARIAHDAEALRFEALFALDRRSALGKCRAVNAEVQKVVDQALHLLRGVLGGNLYSCCLYGSAVRGNLIEGVSDLNFLIVLKNSTAEAHEQIASVVQKIPQIDPFVLGQRGFERSVRAFASKFANIQRNYRILFGADPFVEVQIDSNLERFLCEQAIRNLRLRLIYTFVTRSRSKAAYERFLMRNLSALFVQLSEALRLMGVIVPKEFPDRVPIFEREFGVDCSVLEDLLRTREERTKWGDPAAEGWHERVFPVIDAVIVWIESRWTGES